MRKKMMAIVVGSFSLALGINGFLVPFHLLDGGMIGLALFLHYYWNIKTGLGMILLSSPLFFYAWFKQRAFFYNSLHGLLVSSIFIDLLAPVRHMISVPLPVSAVIGGVLIGFGIGLMLIYETSTGGTDLLAQMVSGIIKVNVGAVIFIIDGIVVLVGYRTIGFESFLYSGIVICIVGLTTSWMVMKKAQSE
ncbi:YitT family protein [Jeotgalibacillus proteolyticus]|uniref:YitT family protein n=1 Tax=Jeotgalibacillus proteolyticus TaxID=2082395 RepID=A0A2S5GDQ8_9BACL|nr:YitT family protein [Jeotgalibacillus proteolyticus]PPA71177.1 hypothetical protein C4B60_03665 [Jeotgalibacillus proteolyticus]